MSSRMKCAPPARGEGASPANSCLRNCSDRRPGRTCIRLALLVFVSALLSACASAKYDAADFPRAPSASGGVTVAWKATILDIALGAPKDRKRTVHLDVPERWAVAVMITQSKPQIPPFVTGRNVVIGVADPIAFFGTNDANRGSTVEKTFVVWRAVDGKLHAASK